VERSSPKKENQKTQSSKFRFLAQVKHKGKEKDYEKDEKSLFVQLAFWRSAETKMVENWTNQKILNTTKKVFFLNY